VTGDPIRLAISAPFAEIILDRPEKRNALSVDMWRAIPRLVARLEASSDAKIVLIHGGETGAFAAGADISEFEEIYATPETAAEASETIASALLAVETCSKPVIAAIEGACVGGGASLALAADLRIAAKSAKFAITPGKLGLVYSAADTRRLISAIGAARAKDVLYTARLIDADEAMAIGLVNRLVETGGALDAARTIGKQIAATSQWSTRATKRMIAGVEQGWDDAAPEAQTLFLEGFANPDFKDGYRAFLEKRPAKFSFD
jgi:enoyl-CoA hydratase/carnithine racemase